MSRIGEPHERNKETTSSERQHSSKSEWIEIEGRDKVDKDSEIDDSERKV